MYAKLKEILEWTLKLYSLTLVIPITLTIVGSMLFILMFKDVKITYLELLRFAWIDYYITGNIPVLDIAMWRLQLVVLIICLLINIDITVGRKI